MRIMFLSLAAFAIACISLNASDSPEFRGNVERSGLYTESGLLTSWPQGGPELAFEVSGLGLGWPSLAVVDNITYTTGMDEKSRMGTLFAINPDGTIKWQTQYGQEWFKSFKGARSTPSIYKGKAYIQSGNGLLCCFDCTDGKILWQVDTAQKYKAKNPSFGLSESVLVVDDKVITAPGGELASMAAFDCLTGQELWAAKSYGNNASYCSPGYFVHNGKAMVAVNLSDIALGVDPSSGEILWEIKYDYEQKGIGFGGDVRANTPQYYKGKVIFSSGYDKGTAILTLSDDARKVELTRYIPEFDVQHHGLVIIDGMVYGSSWDSNEKGKWLCMDLASGEIKYTHNWDEGKGQIIAAEGMLYCYNERNGKLALVKADPAGFNIAGEVEIKG
ncbi:MAG: PQQ-like beta-propeller repeat protein, partial [Sedimentisphaerales bacterium]|nr:PQQ-like beta-propeller repeat protein [Sedimentisphaerales bacterium]